MLDEWHKENNLTWLKVWNVVFSRRIPFPKLLVWRIPLLIELLEVL